MSVKDTLIIIQDIKSVCRGCLKSSHEMRNMFDHGFDDDFCKLTSIKIKKQDSFSKLLCTECEDLITRFRNFRTVCAESNLILNNILKKKELTFEEKLSQNTLTYVLSNKKLTIKVSAPDTKEKITYRCMDKCPERFKKKSDLHQHIINDHKFDKSFVVAVEYYCSMPDCHYNVHWDSGKAFEARRYLNQHIRKVHRDKISCSKCLVKFVNSNAYENHLEKCSFVYNCEICNKHFKTNDRFVVHLMRKHPDLHKKYKMERRAEKRKINPETDLAKSDEKIFDLVDSPKRSFATQTSEMQHIKNDVSLMPWQEKSDDTKKDENSTQTVFDLLSLKSQMSEDDSIFYSETVSLSDIHTQTLPLEFGLSRSNKETITSETQSPDLSIKETQTCFCLYDSLRTNFKSGDLIPSGTFCTTETQTLSLDNDLLSFTSAETQTCFEDDPNKDF